VEQSLRDGLPSEAFREQAKEAKTGATGLDAAVAKLEKEMRLAAQGLDPSVLA
jgi:hypothetical protein